MGPISSSDRSGRQQEAEDDRRLTAAREEFPDWDFHTVFGGVEAVPRGTPVIRGIDLDSVAEKLRQRR